MSEETNNNKGRGLYIVLILLLLGLNGWMFYNAYKNKEDREKSAQQIEEARILYSQLEVQYNESLKQLEEQKGEFDQKDSLIAELQNDLESKRNEIARLLRTCNFFNTPVVKVQEKLDTVKKQILTLEVDCSTYKTQLDELNAKYEALQADYDALQTLFDNEVKHTEELMYKCDSIIDLGGFIVAKDITITGVRKKGNGKDAEGQNAKHTDRLKICFDLLPNKLSAGKEQTFYIKIIAPSGKTLYDEAAGSGEFINKDKPDDNLFSKSVTLNYDGGDVESHCMYWEQQEEFMPGSYTVKVYNHGFLASRSTFTLKKALMEDLGSRL